MSDAEPSLVFKFDGEDPAFEAAYEQARATFRYFWREVAWERRRIVPGLDLACVKAAFSDGEDAPVVEGQPRVEQMWLGEIDFDGQFVSGELLNAPNWLKSVKAGDTARFRLDEITDWMYAIGGEVYGAYTVNLMRSRMNKQERKNHDNAWGLDFGDPTKIRLVPQKKNWFGKAKAEIEEHPMSLSMATVVEEQIAKDPSLLTSTDDKGWTLLHRDALAGSAPTVEKLLQCGADPNARTHQGATPMSLARSLGWDKVVALLARHGATG
jgi:uncharacterized protein YegJ (DUF2314 family)